MSTASLIRSARDAYKQEREEVRQLATDPSVLKAWLVTLEEDPSSESREAVLQYLKQLYGLLGEQTESVYQALLVRLDSTQERSSEVRWRAIEALTAIASNRLRDDAEAIAAIIDCLLSDSDVSVRRWAVVALGPAVAAGHKEAIRVLRRAAENTQEAQIVREEAIEGLEGIGSFNSGATITGTVTAWLQKMLGSAQAIPASFGSAESPTETGSQRLPWDDDSYGILYKDYDAFYLRVVHKKAFDDGLAVVVFKYGQRPAAIKPVRLKTSREGDGYADVEFPRDSDGASPEIAPVILLTPNADNVAFVQELLRTNTPPMAAEDRAVWQEWVDSQPVA